MDDRQHRSILLQKYKKILQILEKREADNGGYLGLGDMRKKEKKIAQIEELERDLYNLKVDEIDNKMQYKFNLDIAIDYLYLANDIGNNYVVNLYEYFTENENHYSYYFYLMILDLISYECDKEVYSQEYHEITKTIDLGLIIRKGFLEKLNEIVMEIFKNMINRMKDINTINKFNKYLILQDIREVNKRIFDIDFIERLIKMFEKMNIMKVNNDKLSFNIDILVLFDRFSWKTNYEVFSDLISDLFINKKRYIMDFNYVNDIYCMVLKNNIEINEVNYENTIYLNYYHIRRYRTFKEIGKINHYYKYYPVMPFSFLMDFDDYSSIDLCFYRFNLDENISISRYLISNADFKCFLEDDGYHKLEFWSVKGKSFLKLHQENYKDMALLEGDSIGLWNYPRYWFHYAYNNGLQPVVGISYYEAEAYCRWLTNKGYAQGWLESDEEIRLPTLEEWIAVARYTDDRPYPWGHAISSDEILVHTQHPDNLLNYPACINIFPRGIGIGEIFDLFGNVDEWICTIFNENNHLVVGGSFEEPLEKIRERHDFLAAVVKCISQNPHFSVLNADTEIVEDQGFDSSPSKIEPASSRLRTLGFRIVRAKRTNHE